MKNSMSRTLLAAALLGSAVFAASAQSTHAVTSDDPAPASAAVAADDAEWAAQTNRCMRETGTRIRSVERKPLKAGARDADCLTSSSGRSHSGEDLRRTGQRNVADALRMVDPAVY